MLLRAIIIDDELHGRQNLAQLLQAHCPEIELVGAAASAQEARGLVSALQPDVVFLDIQMPIEDGFDFLESLPERNFSVVFVTAYDDYGIRAVKASAADYILKPISVEELKQAVHKLQTLEEFRSTNPSLNEAYRESVDLLIKDLSQQQLPQTLTLPQFNGFELVPVKKIVRFEADDSYTHVFVNGEKYLTVSRSLKHFEGLLDPNKFCRVHRSHIINLSYLKAYSKEDGGLAVLKDDERIPISRRRLQNFLDRIQST